MTDTLLATDTSEDEQPTGQCRIDGCRKPRKHHKTICAMHDTRIWRYGNPHQASTLPDDFAIEEAVAGRRLLSGMRLGERRAAGLKLTDRGVSPAEVARILQVAPRTVDRWRAQTAAYPPKRSS